VYHWDAPPGPSNVDAFGQWLGRGVEIATAFVGHYSGTTEAENWSQIEGPDWQLGPWSQWVKAKPGRNLSYAIAPFPQGGSLARCAAGDYDAHYVKLANNLASYGLLSAYLRLGYEMDAISLWGAFEGSGKEASFAGCFRRMVQVMRQTQPANQWKFVFNPTDQFPSKAWLEATWPGDAYVDVVGADPYDHSWASNTYPYPSTCNAACRLTRQQTAWSLQVSRLNVLRDFAFAHGKPIAFPEWGVITRPDGHGGGDNPYYIQKMHEFITNPANKVVFHALFNTSSDLDHRLNGPTYYDNPGGSTRFPEAAARFKELFGSGNN
jgi:Glycosyl hydrolase family 26